MLHSLFIAQLILRNEVPANLKGLLLFLMVCTAFLYVANAKWLESIRFLATIPLQRFNWQSEQFLGSPIFRGTSMFLSSFTISVFVYAYSLGERFGYEHSTFSSFLLIALVVTTYFISKFGANYLFFQFHKSQTIGSQLIDFHSSLNQALSLALGTFLLVDVFYARLDSGLFYFTIILACIYFLLRLYGTILLLQNNFSYPILTVFVYLCTFEIVPALVVAKVLFVNS